MRLGAKSLTALHAVDLLEHVRGQLAHLAVALNARGRDTLWQNHSPTLDAPRVEKLTGVSARLVGQILHNGVVHRLREPELVIAQGRVGLNKDAFGAAELQDIWLLQVRVPLDLIHCRNNTRLGYDVPQPADVEVAQADCPDLAGVYKLLHRLVCFSRVDVGELEGAMPIERKPPVAWLKRANYT